MNKGIREIEELVNHLTNNDRELRSNALCKLIEIKDNSVPGLIMHLISSPDSSIRNTAGEILKEYGELALESMKSFVREREDPDDLKFAIDLMGLIENKSVEDDIIEIFLKSTNENLSLSCIEALGNIRSSKAAPLLTSSFGKNYLFDPLIIDALGKINSKEVLSFLLSKYQNSENIVKYSIIECLGQIGEGETFFFLLSELNSASGALSWVILKSLYNLKKKFGLDIPFDERMKNLILSAINNGNNEERDSALTMLLDFNDTDTVLILANYYGQNPQFDFELSEKIASNTILVLKNVGDFAKNEENNFSELLNLLSTSLKENPQLLLHIPVMEEKFIVSALTDLLNNPGEEIRYCAQELLFMIDPPSLLVCSDLILNDNNIWNRMKFLELLFKIDLPEAVKIIENMTNDPEDMVREKAITMTKINRNLF